MLLFSLLGAAWACCIAIPSTVVPPSTFGPYLYINFSGTSSPATFTRVAGELRLRAPDGKLVRWEAEQLGNTLRFRVPPELSAGTYQLEQRVAFAESGRRLPLQTHEVEHHAGWFALTKVEHIHQSPPPKSPSGSWKRWHSVSSISSIRLDLKGTAGPNTSRIEIEVEGVGSIHSKSVEPGLPFVLISGNFGCGSRRTPLPVEGDIRARAVALNTAGDRYPGPWTTLGPSLQDSGRFWPMEISRPTGHPADVSSLSSWTHILLRTPFAPDSPPPSGECLGLHTAGPARSILDVPKQDYRFAFDQGGQLQVVWMGSREIVINGQAYPSADDTSQIRSVFAVGRDVYVVSNPSHTSVLVLHKNTAKEVFSIDGATELNLQKTPNGVHLTWKEEQKRKVLDVDANWKPLSPIQEVLLPIDIGWPIRVNGRNVLKDKSRFRQRVVLENIVYAIVSTRRTLRVMAIDPRAKILWEHSLPDLYLNAFSVDERGVRIEFLDLTQSPSREEHHSFSLAGSPIPALSPPAPKPPAKPLPLAAPIGVEMGPGRQAIKWRGHIGVVEDGVGTPGTPLPTQTFTTLWADRDEVRVGWVDDGKAFVQSYRCGPALLGIPEMWVQP